MLAKHVPLFGAWFGLSGWSVTARLDASMEDQGQAIIMPDYRKAVVVMNHAVLDEESFIRVLRHEMLHVALYPLEWLRDQLPSGELLGSIAVSVEEQVVTIIEGILDGTAD